MLPAGRATRCACPDAQASGPLVWEAPGRGWSEGGAGPSRSRPDARPVAVIPSPGNRLVPDGISLVFLPPYSPELQPAEHLWPLLDEPIVNRHLTSLDDLGATIAERCRQLDATTLQPHTNFHWWPSSVQPG